MRFPKPEEQFDYWTNIPNIMFDVVQKLINPYAFSILMYMCRKTYGFHVNSTQISMVQMEVDLGISHKIVSREVSRLIKANFIKITKEANRRAKEARYYSINTGVDIKED